VLALGVGALAGSWLLGSLPLGLIGIGLVAAALTARLWARAHRFGATLERRSTRLQHVEGDEVRIAYRLDRRSRVPVGAAFVRERVGKLGEQTTRLRRGRGELVLRSVPRGRYEFQDASVVLEDPLGLERLTLPAEQGHPLLVVPKIVELTALFCETGRRGGLGRRLLLRRPSGFDLHSVREYEVGESLRAVHWPTTARRGQLMVKELEEAPRDDVVVLLDCDPGTVTGPPGDTSFDAQVRAAGAILRAHAARGMRAVLVLGRSDASVVRLASLEDWPVALEALAAVEAEGGRPLTEVLADERGPAARAPELVVVTAGLDPRTADRLASGASGRRRVSVVWVDPAGFAGDWRSPPQPALLRLAGAGVPVAAVRRGEDLADALAGSGARRRSA
jgi:uncharacterized protein (DUF58 family)